MMRGALSEKVLEFVHVAGVELEVLRRGTGDPLLLLHGFQHIDPRLGETEEEGLRLGEKLLWFLTTSMKSAPQFGKFLPGAAPPEAAPMIYRTQPRVSKSAEVQRAAANLRPSVGNKDGLIAMTPERAITQGILFAGTPDTVYKQIMDLYNFVGG